MGLFDKLFKRRKDEIGEIKNHVLGEMPTVEPPPFEPGVREEPPQPEIKTPLEEGLEAPEIEPKPIEEPKPMPIDEEKRFKENDVLEILDRLKFIESQLSAIKSQTETINERLKNLSMLIERRYR